MLVGRAMPCDLQPAVTIDAAADVASRCIRKRDRSHMAGELFLHISEALNGGLVMTGAPLQSASVSFKAS